MRINAKEGDEIWYYKWYDKISTYNLADHLKLKHSKIKSYDVQSMYHNSYETFYTLENGDIVSDIMFQLYENEDEAIEGFNSYIRHEIQICDSKIKEQQLRKQDFEKQLIKTKAL